MAWPLMLGMALLLGGCMQEDRPRAVPTNREPTGQQEFVPREYIVSVRATGDADAVRAIYAPYGIEKLQALGPGRFLVRLAHDPGVGAVRRAGLASAHVAAVERNFIYRYQR